VEKFQTDALRRALEALGSLVVTNNMAIPSAEKFGQLPEVKALELNQQQFAALLTQYQNAAAATFLAYNIMKRRELDNTDATPTAQMQELSLTISAIEEGEA
jgi:hypothetical protein